jgi:hypothetical protein
VSAVLRSTVPAWVRPTLRVTPWTPLLAGATVLVAAGSVVRLAGGPLAGLTRLAAAGLAAAVVAGLHDPAHDLLAAVPVGPGRRRLHRLLLLVPAMLIAWVALTALADLASSGEDGEWPLGAVLALAAAGVAVAVWAPEGARPGAGVAAPLAWVAADQMAAGDGVVAEAAAAWHTAPWPVAALASVAVAAGWRR